MLLVVSVGLALHLVFPQIPGLERSARLLDEASHLLVGAALLAEVASELCYGELLGRSVGALPNPGRSSSFRKGRRGVGRWFLLRLTVTGYGVAHVVPGGGATAAAVTYGALRRRGFDPGRIGAALAAVALLMYGALAILLSASLLFVLLAGVPLTPAARAASLLLLVVLAGAAFFAYTSWRTPGRARAAVRATLRRFGRLLGDVGRFRGVEAYAARGISRLREELKGASVSRGPRETLAFGLFSLGYWAFDWLCMVLVFGALGVPANPLVLLAAYAISTAAAALPLTPRGIGVFETTMLASLALLGVGPQAAIPILGYRLFNFWLPIPLAVLFYPTLGGGRP